jgi:hypothetical protein
MQGTHEAVLSSLERALAVGNAGRCGRLWLL